MREKDCPFYEMDPVTLAEAEQVEAELRDMPGNEEWMCQAGLPGQVPEKPYDGCYGCRHFWDGPGYPGETIYACRRPGNEHIIHTETDLSSLI